LKIYVAGHTGLVGSALVREIEQSSHTWIGATRQELDLLDRKKVFDFVGSNKPDAMIIAAAKVGGILANKTFPVEFLSENLQIETNLIDSAFAAETPKLLFLGSSCIYPKLAPQPLKEEYLLTGPLEETNEPYALAKIAGLKLVQAYRRQHELHWISAMPTNLYGPGDNFSPEGSHVLPALIRRFHEAKLAGAPSVTVWGSGKPLREFLNVDDLASACLLLLDKYDDEVAVNVGSGEEISIAELSKLISKVVGYSGGIEFDSTKPDGTPRKLLENSRLSALGWTPKVSLRDGIKTTYEWFLSNQASN
jgi:GDP-L-fucose synthase